MHNKDKISETICRICGFDDGSIRWEAFNNILNPSYLICECCGIESGLQDSWYEGIVNARRKWLENGAKWRYSKSKPDNWNLEKQLAQIPSEYQSRQPELDLTKPKDVEKDIASKISHKFTDLKK